MNITKFGEGTRTINITRGFNPIQRTRQMRNIGVEEVSHTQKRTHQLIAQ